MAFAEQLLPVSPCAAAACLAAAATHSILLTSATPRDIASSNEDCEDGDDCDNVYDRDLQSGAWGSKKVQQRGSGQRGGRKTRGQGSSGDRIVPPPQQQPSQQQQQHGVDVLLSACYTFRLPEPVLASGASICQSTVNHDSLTPGGERPTLLTVLAFTRQLLLETGLLHVTVPVGHSVFWQCLPFYLVLAAHLTLFSAMGALCSCQAPAHRTL